jgi:hypothetical protein
VQAASRQVASGRTLSLSDGTFCLVGLFYFYDLITGDILAKSSRRAIRYFLYIGVALFGLIYELLKSESVRWPLMAGYALVIGACVYVLTVRPQHSAEEESASE